MPTMMLAFSQGMAVDNDGMIEPQLQGVQLSATSEAWNSNVGFIWPWTSTPKRLAFVFSPRVCGRSVS